MSTLSKLTRGAAASKKCRAESSPPSMDISRSARASEVRGPVATTTSPSGRSVTSPGTTVIRGWLLTRSVTSREKPWRSTARAPPAGTAVSSAQRIKRLPSCRSSSFSRPTAFSSPAARRELEQHSSAKSAVWWAGVNFSGFISRRVTEIPRWASCQAHSLPASPAPMTVTWFMLPPSFSWWSWWFW